MKYTGLFFWISFILLFYSFLGYGILLLVLVTIKRLFKKKNNPVAPLFEPSVTIVVPCYNEADMIPEKIRNTLLLDYPRNLLTIIFITDGSDDPTEEIMKQHPGIVWLHEKKRAGKTAAENRAMKFVKTPFVIFTDANTMLNPEALKNIVTHFADKRVGAVSGEKRIRSAAADNASSSGEEIYWKYESFLKKMDSELYSTVGAAGELAAFRTSLYVDLPEDTITDDFTQSMLIAAAGYIIAYDPRAYAIETASASVKEELKRKIRISAGNWQSMIRLAAKLSPVKTPLLYFQYLSHRVLRWAVAPFLLPVFLLLNFFLAVQEGGVYSVLVWLHIFFYMAAFIGFLLRNRKVPFKFIFVPYYFCVMNYAAIAGFFRFISGNQKAAWEKVQRKTI